MGCFSIKFSNFVKTYYMTLIELKAQAYDILAQIEFLQKKLQETNQSIGEELKKQEEAPSA